MAWILDLLEVVAEGLFQLRRLWSEERMGDIPDLAGYDWEAHVAAFARGTSERTGLTLAHPLRGTFTARGVIRGVQVDITWIAERAIVEGTEAREAQEGWLSVSIRSTLAPRATWVARARGRAGAVGAQEAVPRAPAWLPFALGSGGARALKELGSRGSVVLSDGALEWSARTRVLQLGMMQAVIESHVALASALEVIERDPAGALEEAALHDPDADTRAGAIAELLQLAPDGEEARKAIEAGVEDASPVVATAAAAWAPRRGAERMIAVARDGTLAPAVRARAIEVLGRVRDRDDARHAVIEALGEHALLGAALGALAQLRHPEGQAAVLAAVRDRAVTLWSEEMALALARVFDGGWPGGEPVLIQLLAHPRPRVLAAAAHALGAIGSVRALRSLEACAKLHPAEPAVLQAIAAIRGRLPQSGSLTLADAQDAEGAVTLADPGGVTLAEDSSD